MSTPLTWTHDISEFGERARSFTRDATPAERAAICEALGLLSCDRLQAHYELKPLTGGRYRLSGTLEAAVAQPCVVTLEPVESQINEEIAQEFRPPGEAERDEAAPEHAILSGVDIDEIRHGVLDAGRIVFETLSGALDPYPRKPGAEFDWSDPKAAAEEAGPFSALAKLKKPKE